MTLTELDEAFGHQLVAPRTTVLHPHPDWAERMFHLLHGPDGTLVCMGRQLYPVAGRRVAFAAVSRGGMQHVRRAEEPHEQGDDPDSPTVGPIRVEATAPLRKIALGYREEGAPFAADVTCTGRWTPEPTEPLRIVQEDRVVTHYQNFFQSCWYDGTVEIDGANLSSTRRAGFRDRGWGLRKHEGSPRRGLVLNCACELEDRSLYGVLFETASGRRALTSSWIMGDGATPAVTHVAHDLRFAADARLLGGTFRFHLETGSEISARFEVVNRLFYSEIGYTADADRKRPGAGSFDLEDAATVRHLMGQTANAAVFDVEGETGHGYVESGLGVHARYRPG